MSDPQQKSNWKRRGQISLLVGLLLCVLLAYNNCLKESTNVRDDEAPANNGEAQAEFNTEGVVPTIPPLIVPTPTPGVVEMDPTPTPAPEPPVTEVSVDLGIRNFEFVLQSFSEVTGVPITNNDVRRTYEEVESQLPTEQDVKSFISANQVAITKLATTFCDELVDNANLRASIWPNINFGSRSNDVYTESNKQYLIHSALSAFWGEPTSEQGDRNAVAIELVNLLNALLEDADNNSSTTRMVAKGVCIPVLASAEVLLL